MLVRRDAKLAFSPDLGVRFVFGLDAVLVIDDFFVLYCLHLFSSL